MGSLPRKKPRLTPPPDLILVSDSGSDSSESEEGQVFSERHYTCRVCLKSDALAKYICPRCLTRSCSLACSKEHKTRYKCSGVKERVKYKGKGDLSAEDLQTDLSVLTDASLAVEAASRVDSAIALRSFATGAHQASEPHVQVANLPKSLKDFIVKECGVIFRQSPSCSARRQRNSTTNKKRKLKWRVEWQIYQPAGSEPMSLAVKG